jgi:hypothetical protein
MSDLEDFIADSHGITLHRRRVLKAFSHVQDSPLLDVLLNMTKPTLRIAKPDPAQAAPPAPAPRIVRKGMVNYRRELHGFSDQPETNPK